MVPPAAALDGISWPRPVLDSLLSKKHSGFGTHGDSGPLEQGGGVRCQWEGQGRRHWPSAGPAHSRGSQLEGHGEFWAWRQGRMVTRSSRRPGRANTRWPPNARVCSEPGPGLGCLGAGLRGWAGATGEQSLISACSRSPAPAPPPQQHPRSAGVSCSQERLSPVPTRWGPPL